MNNEFTRLENVAKWYSGKQGFYARLVRYGFKTLQPYFVGASCLELGPADGQMTQLLLGVFPSVTAVDGSSAFCKSLRADFEGVRQFTVECALFEEYTPTVKFDTILATHVLEHVEDPLHILGRIRDWLAPGGRFVVLVPNALSIHRLAAVKMGLLGAPDGLNDLDRKLGHRRVYTPALLHQQLHATGWRIDETGGVFFKPLSNSQIEEWFDEKMMDGFYELGKDFPEHAAETFAVCQ